MPEAEADRSTPRLLVLGTRVTACSFDEAVEWLARAVERRTATYVCATNVYSIMLGWRDPAYRELVNRAGYAMADGVPIMWGLRLLGAAAERVHGDDLFFAFCECHRQRRLYLVGGATGQPELVVTELRRRYPGIEVVGWRATPVRPVPANETRAIVQEIRRLRAEVVWVGMGTPAQDEWMASAVEQVGAPMIGVGSSFDLLAGRTRPAPRWMQRTGLQWLFRLALEPRRLWRRYLINNPLFVALFVLQLLKGRPADGDGPGDRGRGGRSR
jgi:N-acetylglucosaminyldiphosphoundecaprenol N-acetyl-beta-D-mannosaminyltransferase